MIPETMILPDGQEVNTIHFLDTKTNVPRIACIPGLTSFSASPFRQHPWLRTDEVRGVNCPLCKATKEFTDAEFNLNNVLRKKK
jgi:hypothetical protein